MWLFDDNADYDDDDGDEDDDDNDDDDDDIDDKVELSLYQDPKGFLTLTLELPATA